MDNIYIVFNLILIPLIISIIVASIVPKIVKKTKEREQTSILLKRVNFDKYFSTFMLVALIFINICAILYISFPTIAKFIEFNYKYIAICLGVFSIVMDIFYMWMFRSVEYDEEFFVVKRLFSKKIYYYKDVLQYKRVRNMTIQTTKGKILLFNAMAGLNEFEKVLKEKFNNTLRSNNEISRWKLF